MLVYKLHITSLDFHGSQGEMVWADIINLVLEIRRLQLKKVKEFGKPEGLESYEYVGFKLTSSLFTAPHTL